MRFLIPQKMKKWIAKNTETKKLSPAEHPKNFSRWKTLTKIFKTSKFTVVQRSSMGIGAVARLAEWPKSAATRPIRVSGCAL